MTPAPALTAALEAAINGLLAQDPAAGPALAALEGRVVALELEGLNLRLYLLPGAGGLQVLGRYEGEPDTVIRGSPLDLLGLALGEGPRRMFQGKVRIEGDTETGNRLQALLRDLEIDWEAMLARLTGDLAAHQIVRLARAGRDQIRRTGSALARDLSEYLQEELRLLPARIEVDNFLEDVDHLRADTDRLEARIERLARALGVAGGGGGDGS